VKLGVNISASSLDMIAPYNNYRAGYQGGIGVTVFDDVKWIKDLSWETGIMTYYGETGFYPLKIGSFMIVNNLYPLNTAEKYRHRLWTLDVPLKLRYNGFGFMGLTAGIRFSYLLDGVIYIPSFSRSSRGLKHLNLYDRFIPLLEGGVFFPIGQNIIIDATAFKALQERFYTGFRIDVKAYKALDGRFYLSESVDQNGKTVCGGAYSDYGFLVNFAYRLNN